MARFNERGEIIRTGARTRDIIRVAGFVIFLLLAITVLSWIINRDKSPPRQGNIDITSDFIGQWSGNVTQRPPNMQYPVVMKINSGKPSERVGTVNYSTIGCGGELILITASSTQISVDESLTSGLSNCINHPKVTLSLNMDGTLNYNFQISTVVGTVSGTAVLRKVVKIP